MLIGALLSRPENERCNPSVAEAVVAILSSEWPLSMKCIHYRLIRRYGVKVSFAGVYKAVKKLREGGILCKNESLYLLNAQWLDSLYKFSSETKKQYFEKENKYPIEFNPIK